MARFAGFLGFPHAGRNRGCIKFGTRSSPAHPSPITPFSFAVTPKMLAPLAWRQDALKIPASILGDKERAEFRVEDFFHYYLRIKASFLAMNDGVHGQSGGLSRTAAARAGNTFAVGPRRRGVFFTKTDHLVHGGTNQCRTNQEAENRRRQDRG